MQLKKKVGIGMGRSDQGKKLVLCVMIVLCLGVSIEAQHDTQVVGKFDSEQQASLAQQIPQNSHQQPISVTNTTTTTTTPNCTFKCQSMDFYNCSICYQSCTYPNQTVLQLSTCQWSVCNWWQNFVYSEDNPTSTYTRCTDYQTVMLPVQKCMNKCCKLEATEFTPYTLQQCIDANHVDGKTDSTINIVIATSLSGSFILIIATVLMCWCRHRVIVCFDNFTYFFKNLCPCTREEESEKRGSKDSTTDATRNGSATARSRRKWQLLKKKVVEAALGSSNNMIRSQSDINPQLYCSICLDDELNCITSCHHRYHFQCLRTSLSKKSKCPQCTSKSYNPLKIICEFCKQKYTSYKITNDNVDQRHPEFFYDGKIYCNDCLEVHLARGKRSHRRERE